SGRRGAGLPRPRAGAQHHRLVSHRRRRQHRRRPAIGHGSTAISSLVLSVFALPIGLLPTRWVRTMAPSCGENRLSPSLTGWSESAGIILNASFFTSQLPDGSVTHPLPV